MLFGSQFTALSLKVSMTMSRFFFAVMTFGKLVDVFELNIETQDEEFYFHCCLAVASSFRPGFYVNNNLFQRIVSHVWQGILKHKHDEEAQYAGRYLLRHLVDEESAKKMIDNAEMHHCEGAQCAVSA
jgi:hypothetical protein